jgi:hypothetical protein
MSLNNNPEVIEARTALQFLYLAAPPEVAEDVQKRVEQAFTSISRQARGMTERAKELSGLMAEFYRDDDRNASRHDGLATWMDEQLTKAGK